MSEEVWLVVIGAHMRFTNSVAAGEVRSLYAFCYRAGTPITVKDARQRIFDDAYQRSIPQVAIYESR